MKLIGEVRERKGGMKRGRVMGGRLHSLHQGIGRPVSEWMSRWRPGTGGHQAQEDREHR